MNIFFKALLVGTAAGILDAISMVFMGASWQATLAAILHWLALGVIITYARLPFSAWFSGILLALLTGIPMALLIARTGFDAFFFVTASVVLGGLMGLIVEKLILNQPRF